MARPIAEGMPMMHDDDRYSLMGGSEHSGLPPQRKKLELKPRSTRAAERSRRRSTSAKGDPFASATANSPFGNARPREEVLKSRGVDVKGFDSRIEEKAQVLAFTKDQEIQLEEVRAELTKAESRFREANEAELPEEAFRLQVEKKRNKLNALVDKFTKLNAKNTAWSPPADNDRHRSHSPAHRYPNSVLGGGRRR